MAEKTLETKPARNLWLEATASLSDNERAAILVTNLGVENISKSALEAVEKEQERSAMNSLTFSFGGKKVLVRDVLGRILKWTKKFQETADFIVGLDVSGHAAIPWSAIKFFLDIAGKDFEKHGAMLEGLEFVSREIHFYTIFEAYYLNQSSEAVDRLIEALVETYGILLGHLAKAARYYKETTFVRFAKAPFDDGGVDKMISDVEKTRPMIQQYARVINTQQLERGLRALSKEQIAIKKELAEWQVPFERMSSQISHINNSVEIAEKKQILDWVSTIDNDSHHQRAKQDRLEGSGRWLLDHDKLIQWRESLESSVLWLHGIPGSGKTKLSSLVVDTLADPITPLAYFYCARDTAEPERAKSAQILRCILRQLAYRGYHSTIRPELSSKYDELTDGGIQKKQLTLDDSTALIVEIAQNYPAITIIVDALDECEDHRILFERLEWILKQSNCPVRVFLASRNDLVISSILEQMPSTNIEIGENSGDIEKYIRVEVDRAISGKSLLPRGISSHAKQKIIETLIKGADGMFRWVALQLQSLCKMKTEKSVLDELSHLPKQLADIYSKLFEQMMHDTFSFEIATKALKLLACSQRPLPTSDFLIATSQPNLISSSEMLDYCCNLIIEDKKLDIFRFAHLTVREFLEWREGFQQVDLHVLAAEICLQQVAKMRPIRRQPDTQQPQDNLLNYSILFWPVHSQLSGELRAQAPLAPLLSSLFVQRRAANSFSKWMDAARTTVEELSEGNETREKLRYSFCSPADPFFLACIFGFTEVVEKSNISVTQKCEMGLTGLHLASKYGNLEVVNILLARGASDHFRDTYGRTSLFHAVQGGHLEVVETFMANEKYTECSDSFLQSAIILSQNETYSIDIIKLLISRYSDLNKRDLLRVAIIASARDLIDYIRNELGYFECHQDLLDGAAFANNTELLETFLEEDDSDELIVDVDILDSLFNAYQPGKKAFEPLFPAVEKSAIPDNELLRLFSRGGLEPLKFLLDSGRITTISQDAFKSAAQHPRDGLEMLKLLRSHKPDLDVDTNIMITAADNRDFVQALAIVTYLLHLNPGVRVTQIVVERAIYHGHQALTQYLLENFDYLQITDELIEKATDSHRGTTILKFLLEIRPNFKIDQNFLCKAARYADQKALKSLLARAADVRIDEQVCLSAVATNKPSAVRFLLSHASELHMSCNIIEAAINHNDFFYSIDHDINNDLGEPKYRLGSDESHSATDILDMILNRAYEFRPTESISLVAANSDNARECLGYLIARYGSVPVTDDVWVAAASNGYNGAVEVLLGQEVRPTDMEAVLLQVAGMGPSETLELLLQDAGDRVDHKKWNGVASLTDAVLEDNAGEVHDLLASGILPIAEYITPGFRSRSSYLHLASKGSGETLKMLLDSGAFDIDAKDSWGNTALVIAARSGNEATVRLLLKSGADLDVQNKDGETALSLVEDEKPAIVDLLRDWKLKNEMPKTTESVLASHIVTTVKEVPG